MNQGDTNEQGQGLLVFGGLALAVICVIMVLAVA